MKSPGGFRVRPAPDRPDRGVLQYVQGETIQNLVWLTGSQVEPEGHQQRRPGVVLGAGEEIQEQHVDVLDFIESVHDRLPCGHERWNVAG